jgi:hypothetical protein
MVRALYINWGRVRIIWENWGLQYLLAY